MSKKINKQGIIVDDGNNVLLDLRQHIGEANPHKTKFVDLEEKPTTIAGYGITVAVGFPKYATVDLPTLDVLEAGSVVFDTDRVKLLLWNGTDWVSIDTTSI